MRSVLAAAALLAVVLTVYLPGIGHGFIRDDFRWIREGRAGNLSEVAALFTTNAGFYRPLVAVSFAADHAVWGLEPFGYGLTNLTLLIASAALLFTLARRLGLPVAAAVVVAGVFALNFHGVNMALLWLSGRTSLLALLLALLAVNAMLRGHGVAAGILCLGALLSKEEVLALPAVLTVFAWKTGGNPLRTWPMWMALAVYLVLRSTSGAFTPATAPDFYQLSLAPALLLRNAAEYADRAGTLSAAVSLVMLLLVPVPTMPAAVALAPDVPVRTDHLLGLEFRAAPGQGLPAAPPTAPASTAPEPPAEMQQLADVCSDLARLSDPGGLTAVLERTAAALDATGLVLWVADAAGKELLPIAAHGYPTNMLSRMGALRTDAENATAAAFRTGLLQTVSGGTASPGAIAAPLVSPDGCRGVMAAEVRNDGEKQPARRAAASIVAAQLAAIIGPAAQQTEDRNTATL